MISSRTIVSLMQQGLINYSMLCACCYCKGTGSVGDIYDCTGYSFGFSIQNHRTLPYLLFIFIFDNYEDNDPRHNLP